MCIDGEKFNCIWICIYIYIYNLKALSSNTSVSSHHRINVMYMLISYFFFNCMHIHIYCIYIEIHSQVRQESPHFTDSIPYVLASPGHQHINRYDIVLIYLKYAGLPMGSVNEIWSLRLTLVQCDRTLAITWQFDAVGPARLYGPRGSITKSSPWRHHDVNTLSPLLALCGGNPPVTGGFPPQGANNAQLWW